MKNIFLPKVMMCIIALFTLILPASAQNTNATDEYKETLKKIMVLSGASATTDDFFQKITSVMKLNAPEKDEAYWNEFSKNWKEKIESKVFEMYMPVYEKHLTLEELKAVAAFYESPVGKKYKEASLIVMRETMPLLVKQLQTETFKVVRSEKSERVKRGEQRLKEYEQKKKRDKELYRGWRRSPCRSRPRSCASPSCRSRPYRGSSPSLPRSPRPRCEGTAPASGRPRPGPAGWA